MPTTSAGCRRFESGVKSTTSANRIDAEANWSAIVPESALSLSAIDRGRMFSSRLSARSCSIRSAARASSRWRTNCARSPKTTVPAKVTLSAIIVGANQAGKVGPLPVTWPHDPGHQEHRQERNEPAHAGARAVEHQGPERRQDAPQAHRARAGEAAHERHRDRRGEQDVEQFDPQEAPCRGCGRRSRSPRPRSRCTTRRRGRPWRRARGRSPPDERDRQDQDADEHEQGLAQPRLLVVPRIGPDPRGGSIHGWANRAKASIGRG